MIIQLNTVSHRSEPDDYWDDVQEETFDINEREEVRKYKEFDSIKECWEECDRTDIIVSETHIYKKKFQPDYIDLCAKVYDARNE